MKQQVTIQQTAKRYKAMVALGVLLIIVGVVAWISGNAAEKDFHGGTLMIFGFLAYLTGRALAWWNHA